MLPEENEEVTRLRKELAVRDQLLDEYRRVMEAIPECPVHGYLCVPHAIEWVNDRAAG